MKYLIIKNIDLSIIDLLKKKFSLTNRIDKKGNKTGYEIQNNDFYEFINSFKAKTENKEKNLSENSFSKAKRYVLTQRTCKERLILEYFYSKQRISSLNTLSKNIFSDPEYQQFFKSKNKSQLSLALSNLIESEFIVKVERGLYKITLEGTKIMKLMTEQGI